MLTSRLHAVGDMRMHEEERPVPGLGEVLLKITAVGICGSDLHWYGEGGIGDAKLARPLVLGHEFAAVIAEGSRAGERVAVDPAVPCDKCELCLAGHPNLCPYTRFSGHGHDDGALREYMAWPERCLFALPDSISDVDGAMLEPLGVALYAMDQAHLRVGGEAAVFGCGPIGLLTIQLLRAAGAVRVFAYDPRPHRMQAAAQMGAVVPDAALRGPEVVGRWVWESTSGRGVDVAFEIAGTDGAVESALWAVKPAGRVMLVGIPDDDMTRLPAGLARRKSVTLQLVRRMKFVYPRAIALAAQGIVDLRACVSDCLPLSKTVEAFELAAQRSGLKVMVTN
ncbi:MAG: alcohol dehydrogenase catalytic domain-containing protein [Chloroflexi bacterium]|nr:alcohol dehydrogenase catalytic domain-containing protein [Chloroflexota bacterium]